MRDLDGDQRRKPHRYTDQALDVCPPVRLSDGNLDARVDLRAARGGPQVLERNL